MSCEKYSGWLTDAALGELSAEHEPELLAHAMECDTCREALNHAREVRDFVDRGVESLVAGEPSPQFATILRRRIAQEAEPLRLRSMAWAPVIAGALALAVVLAIMAARSTSLTAHPNPERSCRPIRNPIPAPAGNGNCDCRESAERRTDGKHARPQSGAWTRTRPQRSFPEIIVPQGQLAAAAQLSAAINSGAVDGNQLLAVRRESEKPLESKAHRNSANGNFRAWTIPRKNLQTRFNSERKPPGRRLHL